jgi:hypothetical protein
VRKSLVRRLQHEKIAAGHQTKRLGFASLSRKVNTIDDLIRLRESIQSSALRSIADNNQTRVFNLGERLDQMMALRLWRVISGCLLNPSRPQPTEMDQVKYSQLFAFVL